MSTPLVPSLRISRPDNLLVESFPFNHRTWVQDWEGHCTPHFTGFSGENRCQASAAAAMLLTLAVADIFEKTVMIILAGFSHAHAIAIHNHGASNEEVVVSCLLTICLEQCTYL